MITSEFPVVPRNRPLGGLAVPFLQVNRLNSVLSKTQNCSPNDSRKPEGVVYASSVYVCVSQGGSVLTVGVTALRGVGITSHHAKHGGNIWLGSLGGIPTVAQWEYPDSSRK